MTTTSKRQAPPVPAEVKDKLMYRFGYYPKDDPLMTFRVRIGEVRMRWGHVDVYIKPVDGFGGKWIDSERIQLV